MVTSAATINTTTATAAVRLSVQKPFRSHTTATIATIITTIMTTPEEEAYDEADNGIFCH